jgi:peptidoglycan hydrolase-like protein with peptidoglycan-binding domain
VASSSQSPEQAAARAAEPVASWVTASVEERVLSATLIQRGDVAAEVSVSVGAPVSVEQPAVVTRPAPGVGEAVAEGEVVVEVSGRPVFVLDGDAAMYRSLTPGTSGDDVAQLQVALVRLGYEPDVDGVFGERTKTAVVGWYRDAGYVPLAAVETADADVAAAEQAVADAVAGVAAAQMALEDLGRGPSALEVTQAEAAVQQAQRSLDAAREQRVADVQLGEESYNAAIRARDRLANDPATPATELEAAELQIQQTGAQLDTTRRSSADAVTSAEEALLLATLARDELLAPPDVAAADQALLVAVAAEIEAQMALAEVQARIGPSVPLGEVIFVPRLPARIRADSSAPAGSSGERTSLVELSGGKLIVTTTIRPDDAKLVRVGMPVELLDETTSTSYSARVEAIADEPQTGADGQLGLPTVIAADSPLPDTLAGANLRITITSASTEQETLVVPVAAVSSAADGTTHVSVVTDVDDPEPRQVAATAGLSADGFVAITPTDPDTLGVGDLVVVGR